MGGRVFVISELYYPEETSTGYLLTKTAEGLAEHVPVHVICSQPTYSARGTRAPATEVRQGVSIERCGGTTFNKDSLWRRALNAVTITSSLAFRALRRLRSGDIALVVTNPPFLPFAISAACRLRGARCALLIHDVYPEVLIAAGMTRPTSALASVLRRATQRLYTNVDRIIVLGRDMALLARQKLAGNYEKIVLIPNWADDEEITPQPKRDNALLRELNLADRFVIQYAGNMGRTHGLEALFAAATRLAGSDVHWLFIGSGAKKQWLEESARRAEATNITILGNRTRDDQQNFLNACDVAVISFVSGMAGVSVPSRMYNILAAGKPIIAVADPESELALTVEEEQVGWVVPPGDVEALIAVIERARRDPHLVRAAGERARAVAAGRYARRSSMRKYVALAREMLVS
jgi:colanic acid biosynthesis glycosyl transferase WcaI